MRKERLDKLLTTAGVGSRRQSVDMIHSGRVTVDGVCCRDAAAKCDITTQEILVGGKQIFEKKPRYYLLHKPEGYVSATVDNFQTTVLELFPKEERKGLLLVGRLDKNTEGLLLLTDDGTFVHALTAPRHEVSKVYYAVVSGTLVPDATTQFATGIALADGSVCRPAALRILSETDQGCTVEITLHEGKFHQVKRMIAAMGGHVEYLKRLSLGNLSLGDLPKGAWRSLTADEVQNLLQQASKTGISYQKEDF